MEKYQALKTKYQEGLDRASPWNEYPRPSLVRDSFLSLNGEWEFSIFSGEEEIKTKILVPFPPESALSGYEKEIPEGARMEYSRSVFIPEDFKKDKLILHFGAVDTICTVYVDGQEVARHEGGYLPFSADITKYAKESFTLSLTVFDDLSGVYPYGKQKRERGGMWYTPVSGIWQSVWLESVPENYIRALKVTPTLKNVTIEVEGGEDQKLLTLADGGSYSFTGQTITIAPEKIELWSPEDPKIYDFELSSGTDTVKSYFALREIGTKTVCGVPRLTLNGEPYLFNGLLDQGYYPDGIFLPATSEGYREDILRAKELGFNMLRKHIKIEPEIFYTLCDRLGMVVFQDMVNNSGYSFILDTALPTIGLKRLPDNIRHRDKRTREIFKDSMLKTIDRLYSFPSVLYYTIFNEGWGQFNADEMYELAKAHDKTRIYDATSGWFTRHKSDVSSKHVYFKKIKQKGPESLPVVISEFGGYSHRVEGHLFGKDNYGYRLYDNMEDLEEAFLSLYENEVMPLIERGVCALVYTQLSDVEDETNGIMTYDRAVVKLDKEKTSSLMKRLASRIKKG